jgi:hypothetical protein
MSDVSFPVSVPPIPLPQVSPDEGVPGIPEAGVYSNGSYGNSSIGLDTPEAFTPHQVGYEDEGSASAHALQLVKVGVDTLFVRQGTIGSIIPTIGGTALEADYTENELSLPGTATREYWLNITVADGAVTAVSIVTSEPGADSETQAKLLLGSVETDSGDIVAFNSNLSGSQSFASCGSTHFFGLV